MIITKYKMTNGCDVIIVDNGPKKFAYERIDGEEYEPISMEKVMSQIAERMVGSIKKLDTWGVK